MKHLAAYLLLQLTNSHPTKDDVTSLLATVGVEPNKERLDALFSTLEGKDINQVPSHDKSLRSERILILVVGGREEETCNWICCGSRWCGWCCRASHRIGYLCNGDSRAGDGGKGRWF